MVVDSCRRYLGIFVGIPARIQRCIPRNFLCTYRAHISEAIAISIDFLGHYTVFTYMAQFLYTVHTAHALTVKDVQKQAFHAYNSFWYRNCLHNSQATYFAFKGTVSPGFLVSGLFINYRPPGP
jgi:hypothetical protein